MGLRLPGRRLDPNSDERIQHEDDECRDAHPAKQPHAVASPQLSWDQDIATRILHLRLIIIEPDTLANVSYGSPNRSLLNLEEDIGPTFAYNHPSTTT